MPPVDRKNPKRAASSESQYMLREFWAEYPDDDACLNALWRERYSPDGEHAHCPRCDKPRTFKRYKTKQQRQSWTCTACGLHLNPTAGTIFHKSSTSLQLWFYAIYLISSTRCGISAKQLERELGVTYKTAWRMFNLIRNELMAQDDEPLSGEVEADETFYGGRPHAYPKPVKNQHWDKKQIVFGAVERGGRIRAEVVATTRGPLLRSKVHEFVVPGSILYTDEYHAYKALGKTHYRHHRVSHMAKIYVDGDVHTNTIEGFFGLFKNGVRGVYHSVSKKWLQGYVNEYVWRYNHRDDNEAMFKLLLARAASPSS